MRPGRPHHVSSVPPTGTFPTMRQLVLSTELKHPISKNQSAFRPGVANREPVSGESVLQTRKCSERPVAPLRVCGCQKATKHAQSVESDNRSALWEVFPDPGFGKLPASEEAGGRSSEFWLGM
ncbi:hypothetical protein NCU16450 [Neurospora crassa OR74A]|uniref:Uncharacterized protein n=1 Tax=Neurospora crassa (strain ATCC 24698 / 74-OR23-1A / CBS 708.71 / DSM 1257 / FGSC 987) TaxID=367110 RepID=V5IRR1_NEUCR|nr:hypothetical protein NCU16450 [Neurospora crassa OR74A]ESA44316.1 hypothetical protein NCU16450 [Neurospora crassa OR74A]|eukprot:XP_011393420.1 hypothetical protein NCU16450 [Neurospora crassa OR74A]